MGELIANVCFFVWAISMTCMASILIVWMWQDFKGRKKR